HLLGMADNVDQGGVIDKLEVVRTQRKDINILSPGRSGDGDFEITNARTSVHERLDALYVRAIEKGLELLELLRGEPVPEDSRRAARCFPLTCQRAIADLSAEAPSLRRNLIHNLSAIEYGDFGIGD